MDAILLKKDINEKDIDNLLLAGVHDMYISNNQKKDIHIECCKLSKRFAEIVNFHTNFEKETDIEYKTHIEKDFSLFTKDYYNLYKECLLKDLLIAFGMSAIWMGVINGLDAETGIMPNHPFKREIAKCLRDISEILDEDKS